MTVSDATKIERTPSILVVVSSETGSCSQVMNKRTAVRRPTQMKEAARDQAKRRSNRASSRSDKWEHAAASKVTLTNDFMNVFESSRTS